MARGRGPSRRVAPALFFAEGFDFFYQGSERVDNEL